MEIFQFQIFHTTTPSKKKYEIPEMDVAPSHLIINLKKAVTF